MGHNFRPRINEIDSESTLKRPTEASRIEGDQSPISTRLIEDLSSAELRQGATTDRHDDMSPQLMSQDQTSDNQVSILQESQQMNESGPMHLA